MRLAEFFSNVGQYLRGRIVRPVIHVVPSGGSPQSIATPNLVSTFLLGSTDPFHYSLTDGTIRPDKRIDLSDAIKLAEQDPIWASRGKAIQSYAILEQGLCFLLADLSEMKRATAATVFYRITNTDARNKILEKLLRDKHGRKFNLFWSAYFKELRMIDIKRNEIVHWLSAMNAAINTSDMMIIGITLIHPASLGGPKPPPNQITSKHLLDFAIKCDVFARLCNMFIGVTCGDFAGAAAEPWLDIFQRPLVYPLPAGHPLLSQTQPIPDSPPRSSPG